jgi:hypothetical protein
MQKAILIDPYKREITDVSVNDWRDIQSLLQCSIFSGAGYTEDGDALYCNDEGLFDESAYVFMPDYIMANDGLIAGRVLVLGFDPNTGDSKDSVLSADDVRDIDHKFLDVSELEEVLS